MESKIKTDAAPSVSPRVQRLTAILASLLTLTSVAWALDLYRKVGLILFNEQLIAAMIGLALAVVFLHVPARKGPRGAVPWYDAIAAILGFMAGMYVAFRFETLTYDIPYRPTDGLIVSTIIVLLVLEGLRRVAGKALLIIVLVFFAYALFGEFVPGQLEGLEVSLPDVLLYVTLDPHGLVGPIVGIAATIVLAFLLLGAFLARSGGSHFFTDVSVALMGNFRGGSAKIAVIASAFFGSISGSVVANIASTGVITIPMMKKSGYQGRYAGAIETVASTGGQLMPPIMGASAFLMAEFLEVPYSEVVLAALIPALLYYAALFIQVDLVAARSGISAVDKSQVPPVIEVLKAGWFFPVPFVMVVLGLFWLNLPPETAALYAVFILGVLGLLFGYRGERMTLGKLVGAISATGFAVLNILMIASAAGFIIGILNLSGLGFALTLALVKLGSGNLYLLLLLAAGISIILGMGMPTVGVYVLLAALVAPALIEVGVVPIGAHLFVFYFGLMSMITPPVAIGAYAAAAIGEANPIQTAMTAIKFAWLAYVIPFLFAISPSLLLQGEVIRIILAVTTALAGVWLASVGVIGFLWRPVDVPTRLGFFIAGIALLIPSLAFRGALWTDLAGFGVGLALILKERHFERRSQRNRT
ncbi:MAG: TRAP transporter fused permease subunit [Deltaproteobacteria bacterium]|nr:TRAP transporter fused permease subunit [Deltaproteobacteria bacterium]